MTFCRFQQVRIPLRCAIATRRYRPLARDPSSCYTAFAKTRVDWAQGFLWQKEYPLATVIKSWNEKAGGGGE